MERNVEEWEGEGGFLRLGLGEPNDPMCPCFAFVDRFQTDRLKKMV